jgi:uncharacterized protein YkwD
MLTHAHKLALHSTILFLLILLCAWSMTTPGATAASSGSFTVYLPLVVGQAATQASSASPLEQAVVDLTNQLRQANGCQPLTISPELSAAARSHSADMALNNFFSHTSSDGSSMADRLNRVGYSYVQAAENIAAGQATASAVVDSWYASDTHRQNMLNCELMEIGVGYAENTSSTYGVYWTQDFGTR